MSSRGRFLCSQKWQKIEEKRGQKYEISYCGITSISDTDVLPSRVSPGGKEDPQKSNIWLDLPYSTHTHTLLGLHPQARSVVKLVHELGVKH